MKSFFDHETVIAAFKEAERMALHGTREEKSGRFLPPPGWKGLTVTGKPSEVQSWLAREREQRS